MKSQQKFLNGCIDSLKNKKTYLTFKGNEKQLNTPLMLFLTIVLTISVGSIISVTKFSQALMAGTDPAKNEFLVDKQWKSTSFIITFGIFKAIFNLVVGLLSDKQGRRKLHLIGWVIGLLAPILALTAQTWTMIVVSNIFIGIQQAICWSTLIFMMIDLAGKKQSGFMVGINESVGYTSIALFTLLGSYLIDENNKEQRLGPYIFILVMMVASFALTFLLQETLHTAIKEDRITNQSKLVEIIWPNNNGVKKISVLRMSFAETTILNTNLMSICQAGLMTNFLTGLAWGLLVKWAKNGESWSFTKDEVANIVLSYSLFKGLTQFLAGMLSDFIRKRKIFIVAGLFLDAISLMGMSICGIQIKNSETIQSLLIFYSCLLGFGTAIMYPNLLAAISDHSAPSCRASNLGTQRFWRDMGYAVGALLSGLLADNIGISQTIIIISLLTFTSGIAVLTFYNDNYNDKRDNLSSKKIAPVQNN